MGDLKVRDLLAALEGVEPDTQVWVRETRKDFLSLPAAETEMDVVSLFGRCLVITCEAGEEITSTGTGDKELDVIRDAYLVLVQGLNPGQRRRALRWLKARFDEEDTGW